VDDADAPKPARRVRLDLGPLRTSRQFRLLFGSGVITYLGSMMTVVAIPFQVAQLTGSFIMVGLLGLAELVPLVVFGMYGGALADSVDRRRMVLSTEMGLTLASGALLLNALLPQPQVWVLFVVSMVVMALDGLQRPSLEAMLPRVVAHDQLAAAGVLSSVRFQAGTILGPAAGGLILAGWGAWAVYAIDVVSFGASLLFLARMAPVPAPADVVDRPGLRHVIEGWRYARSRQDLLGTYLVDIAAMLFAFPYALFPFVAQEFDAPWALGLLYAAGAVGSLAVTMTSGWIPRVHRHGRAIVLAAVAWGIAIALVGVSPTIWWVLAFLVVAGGADMVSGQFRMLMWNQSIPDELRGRMAGVELLSYSIGPLLGQVRSTTAAQLTSLRASFVSGGLLCVVAVGGVALAMPALWRYDDRSDENTARERERRRLRDEHAMNDDT
jgi:MFS family permease